MKKHLDLKNSTVLLVLFALLFVTTSFHTLAIIRADNRNGSRQQNQTAQVVYPSKTTSTGEIPGVAKDINNCIQVTPVANNLSGQVSNWLSTHNTYGYDMYYDLKNNCTSVVHMIDSGTLVTTTNSVLGSLEYGRIERLYGSTPTPLVVPIPTNSENIIGRIESLMCFACPSNLTSYRSSPIGTFMLNGNPSIKAFSIAVGATVRVKASTLIDVPDTSSSWYRIAPVRFKWFYQSALATSSTLGSQIDPFEIRTYSFPDPNASATDLVHFPM